MRTLDGPNHGGGVEWSQQANTMQNLIAASLFFLLIHFGISGTRLRGGLVARLGDGAYQGLFSLVSIGGLVWMIYAYRHAPAIPLWMSPPGLRPLAYAVVLIGFLLAVIGLTTPSPTQAGGEARLKDGADPVRGILRITRHPFLSGVALWALAHIVMNGDLASQVLFGSLLLLTLGGPPSIDAKRARSLGERWVPFAQATSAIPFAAILGGRNSLYAALSEIGLWRPLVALGVFALLFHFHGRFFGSPL
jgi:uncharacterized membrane protein